jgi:transcription termination factor Rho
MSRKKNRPEKEFTGMLELIGEKKFGFIRGLRHDLPKGKGDPFVPPSTISKFKLRDGVILEGTIRPGRKGAMQVSRIHTIMGVPTETWARMNPFDSGHIVYPKEKFNLVTSQSDVSMRIVDLVTPIGKGQRALIVAPPRTGKTIILKQIAAAMGQNHPEVELVALLVDERPEEVTDFVRSTSAKVFASSNDREDDNHVRVSSLALEYARRLVELRRDVVLLLDSLTRLGRTFNLYMPSSGRTMSGGLDSRAMKIPRRIFGSARNIEGGGSLTIIATALIETGSRMDEVIYEEFKGTGNSEIVLDRQMANKRVYPAINLRRSRTRNEELLLGDLVEQQNRLLSALNSRSPIEAMQALIRHIQQTPTNDALLNDLVPG